MNIRRARPVWPAGFAAVLLCACVGSEGGAPSAGSSGTPPPRPTIEWQPQASGVETSLRGISACSERVAWASGEAGTCLRTTDGGAVWQRIEVLGGEARSLRDVHAFGADEALLVNAGQPAVLLRTEDGGRSWREVYRSADPAAFFDSVDFDDGGRRGVAFSDPAGGRFLVIESADGGRSWVELGDLPEPVAGEAGFAASGTMVEVVGGRVHIGTGGSAARVLTRTGDRWHAAATPLCQGESSQGVFSLAFSTLEPRIGVAVGGDYQEEDAATDTAAWTDDGGTTWRAAERMPGGYRSAVAWVPGTRGTFLAVGPRGADLSVDGGRTFAPCGEAGYHAIALAVAAGGAGWAVGSDGRIARVRVTW